MTGDTTTVRASIDLALEPRDAFDLLIEELSSALAREGVHFESGAGGHVVQGEVEVGRVTSWESGRRATLEWRPADWQPDEVTEVVLEVERVGDGTRATVEHRGWGRLIGSAEELAGWFAGAVAAPLLGATAPHAFGDWLTDRQARRPSGAQSRAVYGDPLYHYPNFRALLEELALTPEDYLLEVGCGGGAFLEQALRSGCRAAAIDHSADMLRLARQKNREAVLEERLEVHEGKASRLPFPDETFTCAVMTGVLGFLADPVVALAEVRRVLRPGGRFLVLGSDPEVRGTPAAPEPMASRLRFYDDDGLAALGRDAGFDEVQVLRRDLSRHAREVGVPEEHVALFEGPGPGARFLLARRR